MRPEEYAHIRADIEAAVSASGQSDPTLPFELLTQAVGSLAALALGHATMQWKGNPQGLYYAATIENLAGDLLRGFQIRAVSGIPYGEPTHDEPEDHR